MRKGFFLLPCTAVLIIASMLVASIARAQEPILPKINATTYFVAELRTGQVIAEQNAEAELPIASLTKLMTAIVATERLKSAEEIIITDRILATEGDAGGLWRNERWTVHDLLAALLLESSNDAAAALASTQPAGQFVSAMNEKARQLDLTNTVFVDPAGLSPRNHSTARSLFKLAQALNEHYPGILELSRQRSVRPTPAGSFTHYLKNFNGYAGQTWFIGGKIGFLPEIQQTYLGVFKIGDEPVAVIVLGAADRFAETNKLLTYAAERAHIPFVIPNICADGARLASRHVANVCQLTPDRAIGKEVELNLGTAKIRLYEDGQLRGEYGLSARPVVSSKNRIPTGLYHISRKTRDATLPAGRLRAHYLLTLDNGVRFISWPLRGQRFLAPRRLTSANALIIGSRERKKADAQAIYDFTEVDTPVVIYE